MAQPPQVTAVETRRAQRAAKKAKREEDGDASRSKGNDLFNAGDLVGAANHYAKAIYIQGPRPIIMSNLAAVYLKLEVYDAAEWAATTALEYDPKMTKARFRRGMARKATMQYEGAEHDFDTIIRHEPKRQEVREELKLMRSFLASGDSFKSYDSDSETEDERYPLYDDEPWPTFSDSDSPDCAHSGNGVPCRFYNHNGCARGNSCRFSHAPDSRSVRDELGKNVCSNFLLGFCRFGASKCMYSHDKIYLPAQGWWNYPDQVRAAKRVREVIETEDTYDEVNKVLRKNPQARNYGARRHREEILDFLDLQHLTVLAVVEEAMEERASSERFVLLISLEEDYFVSIYTHLLNALRQKIRYVQATTTQQAMEQLDSPGLVGVFATDAAVSKQQNSALLNRIVQYVKDGGSFVTGGMFSNHVRPSDFPPFIKAFSLDWTYGSYHRTTFALNLSNEIVRRNPSLVPTYSMKALHVGNILREHAVYGPTDQSRIESIVFAPAKITDRSEAPAVCARVGRGLFSFLGDVNGENASTNTILAMLGLLDGPNPPLPATNQDSRTTSSNSNQPSSSSGSGRLSANAMPDLLKKSQNQNQKATRDPNPEPRVEYAVSAFEVHDSTPGQSTQKQNQKVAPKSRDERCVSAFRVDPQTPKPAVASAGLADDSEEKFVKSDKCVVILALQESDVFEQIYADQVCALRKRAADVKVARTAARALIYLASSNLGGVFIADEGLAKSANGHVLTKVVEFVKSGGQAVIGGLFPMMTDDAEAETVFAAFGLGKWRTGSNSRAEAELNRHHETAVKNEDTLPDAFYMRAIHVTGFLPEDMFYEQCFEEYDDDSCFVPPGGDAWEAPVLQTHVGNGQLGYIGDIDAVPESTKILLSMFDLLACPKALVPDSQKFIVILSWSSKPTIEAFDKDFIADAKSKVEVLFGLSNARAVELLKSPDIAGVFIADADILAPLNAYLLSKLVEYSKTGGTLVFGRFFSQQVSATQFRPFFRNNWGFQWNLFLSSDDTIVAKNLKNDLPQSDKESMLPKTFRLEGTYVDGIAPKMAVYCAQNRPDVWKPEEGVIKSAIVYASVENGYIGYIGVNTMDGEIRSIINAMLGLL